LRRRRAGAHCSRGWRSSSAGAQATTASTKARTCGGTSSRSAGKVLTPLVLLGLVLASWALRPARETQVAAEHPAQQAA
jgi:hypothetical protein